jgi:hypothetical protein
MPSAYRLSFFSATSTTFDSSPSSGPNTGSSMRSSSDGRSSLVGACGVGVDAAARGVALAVPEPDLFADVSSPPSSDAFGEPRFEPPSSLGC